MEDSHGPGDPFLPRLGRLPEAQAEAVARHLEECPACAAAAQRVAADSFIQRVHKAGAAPSNTPMPPGGLNEGVMAVQGGDSVSPPHDAPPELAAHPKFRVLRKLGEGGMGAVWLAEHRLLGRLVAVKVISPALLGSAESLARFRREVRAAGQLDHPNIVRAFDAEEAGGLHLLVMEYVEGPTLAAMVARRGPMSVIAACRCTRQAATALEHARERGMVHRDVKPQNLVLANDGRVRLLDFGLARLASEQAMGRRGLTASGVYMGTPEFMAPEQALDARTADTRTDVYSLGCTLYYLLAGRAPFAGDTPLKQFQAHQYQ